MDIDYTVAKVYYNERLGNLTNQAVGVVKSNKFFPCYEIDGKRMIFKPLSATKPFCTPLFALAEVVWSNYAGLFMEAPRYQLAQCIGYSEASEGKYADFGTLVPSIVGEGEHLVNLLEWYRAHPDPAVDIDQYENYCMRYYDYTPMFCSEVFQVHPELAQALAMQVLFSVLKADQNFHYENTAFICDESGNIKRLAPMIDHEFSLMFLLPDCPVLRDELWVVFADAIKTQAVEEGKDAHVQRLERLKQDTDSVVLYKNLTYIQKNFPETVQQFLRQLNAFMEELQTLNLTGWQQQVAVNSNAYQIGIARFKEHDLKRAQILQDTFKDSACDLAELTSVVRARMNETARLLQELL
jgi:hypothetical protein